jgi:putative hydrolase of the HAD superfamily
LKSSIDLYSEWLERVMSGAASQSTLMQGLFKASVDDRSWKDGVRSMLHDKAWFGFDLDDTLHEFRKAFSAAVLTTLSKVSFEHQIPIDDLQAAYKKVLAQKTAQAFTDGKSSDDYRKERFAAVLRKFSVEAAPEVLDGLAAVYKAKLRLSLELKPGACNLLAYLKSIGKKIVIITEGPQDAQEWTLKNLDLSESVDYLATTNYFGVSKIDGLFDKVLAELGIEAGELAYVGDSLERDILPAGACGIFPIDFSEQQGSELKTDRLKIKSLDELERMLRRSET